jgi:hypothetical protein
MLVNGAINTGGSSSKITGGSAADNNGADRDLLIHGAIDEWISSSSSPAAALADQPVIGHDLSEPDHHNNCGKNRNQISSSREIHHDDGGGGGGGDADAAADADRDHDAGDRDRLMAVGSNSQKNLDDDPKRPSAGNY